MYPKISSIMTCVEIAVAVLLVILTVVYEGVSVTVHPILMCTGPLLLTGKASLVYRKVEGTRKCKIVTHLALQFVVVAFCLFFRATWKSSPSYYGDRDGIYSLPIFGILWAIQSPGGWRNDDIDEIGIGWHAVMGTMTYVIAGISCGWIFWDTSTLLQVHNLVYNVYSFKLVLMELTGLLLFGLSGIEFLRVREYCMGDHV